MARVPLVTENELLSARVVNGKLRFTRENGEIIEAGALLKGDKGDQGIPGVNAVPTDTAIAAYGADENTQTRKQFDNLYKYPFRYGSNPDTAVNALIATALTYVDRPEFVYGNFHTLYNSDTSQQSGKWEIDCSSFVMAALEGITFANSKYSGNATNVRSRVGLEAPSKYWSPSQHRYLANDIAFYAYDNGWLFDLATDADFDRLKPGDVLFFSNNAQWAENWRQIGHVSIVTKIIQNEGKWIETIEADIRANVVTKMINSVDGLKARKASCAARFPLQDSAAPVLRINNAATATVTSTGYPIRTVITSESLLENQLYTLFFKANIPAGRFPVISVGSTVIDSFTETVVKRPDGLYRTSFYIPKGTIAANPGSERRLTIGFGGPPPYPTVTSDFAALYKGFITELPSIVDPTAYEEGTFIPELRGRTVAGVQTYGRVPWGGVNPGVRVSPR